MAVVHLAEYLDASARRWPNRTAVVDPDGTSVSYADLNCQADAFAASLRANRVAAGDRVGIMVPKSIAAVIAIFGTMKAGAAYVPVDVTAPAERGKRILSDCRVRAVVVAETALAAVPDADECGVRPLIVTVDEISRGSAAPIPPRHPSDLAYILYTSGSTGIPKGVMLTHENAVSFVEWCSSTFGPTEDDRFSSHAPFHFDLSVLDIYLAIKHGAALHLIPEELGKSPKELARFIADRRLTVWYSTPSILALLLQYGNLPSHDVSSLRIVLFAGEVFPVKHLRALKQLWPAPVYFNLYGPTETNVCTFARIPELVPSERTIPYPIGFPCSHCAALVLDDEGREVAVGDEGLLHISGPSVFGGYWNRPIENAAAFLDRDGVRWYNTGDVVRWEEGQGYIYTGRKDRMVKRRGYRIELGEIERALYQHAHVSEAAVIAVPDADAGVRIIAFLAGRSGDRPSIIDLKTFCGRALPAYMNPDQFVFQDRLPKTSTDKIDYQTLRGSLEGSRA